MAPPVPPQAAQPNEQPAWYERWARTATDGARTAAGWAGTTANGTYETAKTPYHIAMLLKQIKDSQSIPEIIRLIETIQRLAQNAEGPLNARGPAAYAAQVADEIFKALQENIIGKQTPSVRSLLNPLVGRLKDFLEQTGHNPDRLTKWEEAFCEAVKSLPIFLQNNLDTHLIAKYNQQIFQNMLDGNDDVEEAITPVIQKCEERCQKYVDTFAKQLETRGHLTQLDNMRKGYKKGNEAQLQLAFEEFVENQIKQQLIHQCTQAHPAREDKNHDAATFFSLVQAKCSFNSTAYDAVKQAIASQDSKQISQAFKAFAKTLEKSADKTLKETTSSYQFILDTYISELARKEPGQQQSLLDELRQAAGGLPQAAEGEEEWTESWVRRATTRFQKEKLNFMAASRALSIELEDPLFKEFAEAVGPEEKHHAKEALDKRLNELADTAEKRISREGGLVGKAVKTAADAAGDVVKNAAGKIFGNGKKKKSSQADSWHKNPAYALFQQAKLLFTSGGDVGSMPNKLFLLSTSLFNYFENAHKFICKEKKKNKSFAKVDTKKLKDAIRALKKAQAEKNQAKIEQHFHACEKILKNLHIQINTLGVPKALNGALLNMAWLLDGKTKKSVDHTLEKGLAELNKARQNSEKRRKKQVNYDYKALIQEEKLLFVENTAKFAALSSVFNSNLFGKNLSTVTLDQQGKDKQLFFEMIAKSGKGSNSYQALKEVMAAEMKKRGASLPAVWMAKLTFAISIHFVQGVMATISDELLNEIFTKIEQNKGNQFASYRHLLISKGNDYLSIINGALHRIGTADQYEGSISKMLEKELRKKEHNEGFEVNDLYAEFVDALLAKMNNPILSWMIKLFMGSHKPEYVNELITQGLNNPADKGNEHKINLLLLEQMEDLWKILTSPNNEKKKESKENRELANTIKGEIAPVVKNFLEVVHLSNQKTPGELQAFVRGKSIKHAITTRVDSLFIDNAIKAGSENIALALTELLTEKRIEEFLYKLMQATNTAYTVQEPVSDKEFNATKRRLTELRQQMLSYSIKKAVKEGVEWNNKKEQEETNRIIKGLKDRVHKFNRKMKRDIKVLQKNKPSKKGLSKLQNRVIHFLDKTVKQRKEIENGSLSTESKKTLATLFEKDLGNGSRPLVKTCKKLSQLCNGIDTDAEIRSRLKKIKEETAPLTDIPSIKKLNQHQLIEAITKVQKQSKTLKEYNRPSAQKLGKTLISQNKELEKEVKELLAYRSLKKFAKEQEKVLKGDLDPKNIRAKIPHLKGLVESKIEDKALKKKLLSHLNKMKKSADTEEKYKTYNALIKKRLKRDPLQAIAARASAMETEIDSAKEMKGKKNGKKGDLGKNLGEVEKSLKDLRKWTDKTLDPIAYLNLNLLPKEFIENTGTYFAINRVQEKIDDIYQFIRDPIHHRYFGAHRPMAHWVKKQKGLSD